MQKPVIGIIGGICSGKSTVAAELVKLGCKSIDADEIAHEQLENKTVKSNVISVFGEGILDSAGKIDRRKLASDAFADRGKLSLLNSVVHPPVLQHTEQLIQTYDHDPAVKAIVLDMPLLVEVGWAGHCDVLIFVRSSRQLRAARAQKMGLLDKEFSIRENFQISLDRKAAMADNIINNNSCFSALVEQVTNIFSCIMAERGLL